MKQLFLFLSFVLVASFANAQSCMKSASAGKSCCASKKTASAATGQADTQVASVVMEADAAMNASNGNIVKRTCEMSGNVSYYEKSVCADSGKVSWNEVKYDSEAKSFTKVASASMEKNEAGEKVEAKSCGAKAEGKACCKKGASAKACAGEKAKSEN